MEFAFDATMAVAKNTVTIEARDPSFLIRARVAGYLEQTLSEYLDPKVSLGDLQVKRRASLTS